MREPTLLSLEGGESFQDREGCQWVLKTVSQFRKGIDNSLQGNLPVGPRSALLLLLGNSPVSTKTCPAVLGSFRNLSWLRNLALSAGTLLFLEGVDCSRYLTIH